MWPLVESCYRCDTGCAIEFSGRNAVLILVGCAIGFLVHRIGTQTSIGTRSLILVGCAIELAGLRLGCFPIVSMKLFAVAALMT